MFLSLLEHKDSFPTSPSVSSHSVALFIFFIADFTNYFIPFIIFFFLPIFCFPYFTEVSFVKASL